MDLTTGKYDSFDQLYDYCYKVASVVGLVCIHIFGFDNPDAIKHAEFCGIAFQLTNILRDLREDAAMGRIYLPEEDLWAFGYTPDDLVHSVADERFMRLMKFEALRARCYYNAALPLISLVHKSGRPGLCAMIDIYSGILNKIEKSNYDVFKKRVSLSKMQKISIATRTLLASKISGGRPYQPELRS
jgi:phytoene synthase